MVLKVPATTLATFLDTTMGAITPYLFLFGVDVTPGVSTLVVDIIPSVGWMSKQLMTGLSGAGLAGFIASVTWDPVVFTNNTLGPVDVYGYGVCDLSEITLYWAERSGSAPVTVPDGATYTVFPYYERENEP